LARPATFRRMSSTPPEPLGVTEAEDGPVNRVVSTAALLLGESFDGGRGEALQAPSWGQICSLDESSERAAMPPCRVG
jgi:hypothetical protein